MIVWVVEWSMPDQGDACTYIFDTELNAQLFTCQCILQTIGEQWDFEDSELKELAQDINHLVAQGQYKKAINKYNDDVYDLISQDTDYYIISSKPVDNKSTQILLLEFDEDDYDADEDDGKNDLAAITNLYPSVAVNDHRCNYCGNDKVSKIEKTCWKCGASL